MPELGPSSRAWVTKTAFLLLSQIPALASAEENVWDEPEAPPKTTATTASVAEAPPPASEIPASETPMTTETDAEPTNYIKGELIGVGTRELVSRYDHAGIRIGPSIITKDLFLSVTPNFGMYFDKFSLGLQVPLNLLLLEGGSFDFGGMKVRKQDWDEASDFAKVLRFLTYGKKEDNVYFTIDSLRTVTIGHGGLLHRYQGAIDIDRVLTGVELDLYNDYGGFQVTFNDVTARGQILGALAFIKPMGFVENAHWLLRSISLGIEYAGDFNAPRCVRVSVSSDRCVPGSGSIAGIDPITGVERDDTFVRTDPDTGRPVVETVGVHALGFSAETRVFDHERANIKLYGTFHQFLDHGGGIATGLLGRFTAGERTLHAFRVRSEFRTFDYDYLPGYFDTLYEITKYQYAQSASPWQVTPTKFQAAFGDPENGFVVQDQDRRVGLAFDLNYAIFKDSEDDKLFGFGVGIESSTAPNSGTFYAHLEAFPVSVFQVFGSFMRLNMESVGDIFSPDGSDSLVVLSGARLQLLPIVFLNLYFSRQFQIVRSPGLEFHLGNSNVVNELGEVSPYFASDRIYEGISKLMFEIELGLEFNQ